MLRAKNGGDELPGFLKKDADVAHIGLVWLWSQSWDRALELGLQAERGDWEGLMLVSPVGEQGEQCPQGFYLFGLL